jgi:hypothetical protein
VLNFDYVLPIFAHSKGLAHNVLGGWTLSGVSIMQTGNPLSINAGTNTLGLSGSTTDHAQLAGGKITYPHTVAQWFNATGAVQQPAPLVFGNAPKNFIKGPGRDNWNLSLFKDFRFNERAGVQFKAESFNTWNHTQFTGVNTGVLSGSLGTAACTPTTTANGTCAYNSTAGAINGVADPRVFQLGAKAYF